jgi:hypothetical protein
VGLPMPPNGMEPRAGQKDHKAGSRRRVSDHHSLNIPFHSLKHIHPSKKNKPSRSETGGPWFHSVYDIKNTALKTLNAGNVSPYQISDEQLRSALSAKTSLKPLSANGGSSLNAAFCLLSPSMPFGIEYKYFIKSRPYCQVRDKSLFSMPYIIRKL